MWRTLNSRLRVPATLAASVALIAAVIFVPPVRSAAAQFLDVFRVQHLKVISFDATKAQSLASFKDDLFSNTEIEDVEPVAVTSAEDASQLAGYAVRTPSYVPEGFTSTEFTVTPQGRVAAQVNVAAVRALLQAANLPTDALPTDPDDAYISAMMPPLTVLSYADGAKQITIHQERTPEVSIPEGLDLNRLGSLALQLLGMWPDEADRVSASIDWATTLVIPLPSNASSAREVAIHGTSGYLLTSEESGEGMAMIWQEGDILYAVSGRGDVNESEIIKVAESLQ